MNCDMLTFLWTMKNRLIDLQLPHRSAHGISLQTEFEFYCCKENHKRIQKDIDKRFKRPSDNGSSFSKSHTMHNSVSLSVDLYLGHKDATG